MIHFSKVLKVLGAYIVRSSAKERLASIECVFLSTNLSPWYRSILVLCREYKIEEDEEEHTICFLVT